MKLTLALLLFTSIAFATTAQSQAARLVIEPCPDYPIRLADMRVKCSRLHVPEDRSSDESSWISLFVARLSAREDNDQPPIVYLAGGPGDSATAEIDWWLSTPLRDDRDIILIDQRGTGLSRPSLNCPEFDTIAEDDRLAKCLDRLQAAGIDLATYNADSMTQDIADLITVLELDQVNIYARSYGARQALLLAQMLPQRIRAMVLDGAYTGAESALESAAANTRQSLQRLFADCKASKACNAAYPKLSTQFDQAAAALNAQPATVDGILPNANFQLDGRSFVFLLRDMLADSTWLPYVPALIASIAQEDYGFPASVASDLVEAGSRGGDTHSEGLYFSAFCLDEATLTTAEEIQASGETLPSALWQVVQLSQDLLADCRRWIDAADTARTDEQPHEIPTLYLSGAYDPITPSTGDQSESPLVWRLVLPHIGHGVLENEPCAETVVDAFLANPAGRPSDSCLAVLRRPTFHIPENE